MVRYIYNNGVSLQDPVMFAGYERRQRKEEHLVYVKLRKMFLSIWFSKKSWQSDIYLLTFQNINLNDK